MRLVAVVGATATGKSEIAVELAREFNGEVVNADSRLFYRGLDIGTAKPTLKQRRGVPHHLIDFLSPTETYNLAAFLKRSRSLIAEISDRGSMPILAGGTGQYVWGLLEGWEVPEIAPDERLRDELESLLELEGVDALYDRLTALDAGAADLVDRLNPRRLIRAIERAESGVDAVPRKAKSPPYESLVIGIEMDRHYLHVRISKRIAWMVANGWADEVRKLLEEGVSADAPAMSAIGYREMAAHVRDEKPLEYVMTGARHATTRLVRHQNNWFKRDDPRIRWIDGEQNVMAQATALVRNWVSEGR